MSDPPTKLAPTFQEVFDAQLPFVWSTLRRLGVYEADRPDVAHDAFLQIFRHWADYDASRPLRPWIFVFAARAASDYRRKARHRREVLGDEAVHAAASLPVNARVSDPITVREQRHLLEESLANVDEERLPVLLLHELEEVTVPEIARLMNIPTNTAYSRLRLAREELTAAVRKIQARGDR